MADLIKKLEKWYYSRKKEKYVAIDIGFDSIKVLATERREDGKHYLIGMGTAPTPPNAIKNNTISDTEKIGAAIRALVAGNGIEAKNATFVIPGNAVFTKRVSVPFKNLAEFEETIQFEAANYIPNKLDTVKFDWQIVGKPIKGNVEVLFVAIRKEIIESYASAISKAGLIPVVADVEYFALGSNFFNNYPEESNQTVALVNIGSRYCNINIMEKGEIGYSGDVSMGAGYIIEKLREKFSIDDAEAIGLLNGGNLASASSEEIAKCVESLCFELASEINRQLSFFWSNIQGAEPLKRIYLTGGGTKIPGITQAIGTSTGLPCMISDNFKGIEVAGTFDREYLEELGSVMGISIGLSLRQKGDKNNSVES